MSPIENKPSNKDIVNGNISLRINVLCVLLTTLLADSAHILLIFDLFSFHCLSCFQYYFLNRKVNTWITSDNSTSRNFDVARIAEIEIRCAYMYMIFWEFISSLNISLVHCHILTCKKLLIFFLVTFENWKLILSRWKFTERI